MATYATYTYLPAVSSLVILGWVDFGYFYLRPTREPALDLYKYNTSLDGLKFISSLKTIGEHTYNV